MDNGFQNLPRLLPRLLTRTTTFTDDGGFGFELGQMYIIKAHLPGCRDISDCKFYFAASPTTVEIVPQGFKDCCKGSRTRPDANSASPKDPRRRAFRLVNAFGR